MRKIKVFLIFILIIFLHNYQYSDSLTTVYVNGKVFTGVKDSLREALVVKGGRIFFTGEREKALRFVSGKRSNIIDLKGKTIIPGFHDADINFPLGARLMGNDMNFQGLDLDSILHRLKAKKKNLKRIRELDKNLILTNK